MFAMRTAARMKYKVGGALTCLGGCQAVLAQLSFQNNMILQNVQQHELQSKGVSLHRDLILSKLKAQIPESMAQ